MDRGRNGRGHVDNFQAHDPEVCRLAGRTIPRFAALKGARSLGLLALAKEEVNYQGNVQRGLRC